MLNLQLTSRVQLFLVVLFVFIRRFLQISVLFALVYDSRLRFLTLCVITVFQLDERGRRGFIIVRLL